MYDKLGRKVRNIVKKLDQQQKSGGSYGPAWEPVLLSKEERMDDSPDAIKKRYSELRDKLRPADKSGG